MATNQDLQQVNTFTGGMNTDVSDSLLKTDQYKEARNLRIVTNTDNNTGELRLIEGGKQLLDFGRNSYIKAFTNCQDLPIVVVGTTGQSTWYVYTLKLDSDPAEITQVLTCDEAIGDHLSVETVYESEDNIKLYIADGIHPIMVINCKNKYGTIQISQILNINDVTLPQITDITRITGNLKPALVQYSYQYYNKYGTSTRISPLSKLYLVNSTTVKTSAGVEYDKVSNTGYRLVIPKIDNYSHLIVYRITYQQAGQPPTVEVIYNNSIQDDNTNTISIDDTGFNRTLATYTAEQYNSFGGIAIIPSIIKSSNNILFAANTKELAVSIDEWKRFEDWDASTIVNSNLDMSEPYDISDWIYSNVDGWDSDSFIGTYGNNCRIKLFEESRTIDSEVDKPYIDQRSEGLQNRSLHSDEIYRYGIVLYHSDGSQHPVKWVGDIRTKNLNNYIGRKYTQTGNKLVSKDLHVEIDVKNLPQGCSGYEIVRCERTDADKSTITQGVISAYARPVNNEFQSIIHPTGYLALNRIEFVDNEDSLSTHIVPDDSKPWVKQSIHSETSVQDNLLFYSPDVSYNPVKIKNLCDTYPTELQLECALYSADVQEDDVRDIDITNIDPQGGYVSGYNAVRDVSKTDAYSDDYGVQFNVYRLSKYANGIGPQFYRRTTKEYPRPTRTEQLADNDEMLYLRQKLGHPFSWVQVNGYEGSTTKMTDSNMSSLYNISNSDDYAETKLLGERTFVSYNKMYRTELLSSSNPDQVDISTVVIPETPKFNEFSDSEGRPTFKDSVTAVSDKTYNGWIAHQLYGSKDKIIKPNSWDWKYNTFTDADIKNALYSGMEDGKFKDGSFAFSPLGIGGKCAVLSGDFLHNDHIERAYSQLAAAIGAEFFDGFRTMICSIRKRDVVPYGGTGKTALQNSVYYSTGYYQPADSPTNYYETKMVNDGDTYAGCFEIVTAHQQMSMLKNHINAAIIYSVPIESDIDLQNTHGVSYSRSIRGGQSPQYIALLQEDPASIVPYYNQTEPMYQYNPAYSSEANVKVYVAENEDYDVEKTYNSSNRIFYSNVKTQNEPIDSWTQFQPANFLDVDSKYGEITQLDTFNNRLFFWQEDAFGVLSVHERVQMQDENNLTLMLGTGGVLDRYDYLTTLKGMKKNQFVDVKSQIGLYWWDEERNELQVYRNGSQPTALSKEKNVQNYLNSNQNRPEKRSMFFDPKYDEVLSNVANADESVVFSELINAYSSIYDINFFGGITVDGGQFLACNGNKNSYIIEWNRPNQNESEYQSVGLYPSITYIINHQPLYTKVFDNQVFSGEFYGGSDTLEQNRLPYYIKGEHVNDPLNVLSFDYKTPLKQNSSVNGEKLTNREYDYRLAIPRDGDKPEYGGRLRGKTMQCKLSSSSNSLDFSLQHIITKFRISWS